MVDCILVVAFTMCGLQQRSLWGLAFVLAFVLQMLVIARSRTNEHAGDRLVSETNAFAFDFFEIFL